MNVTRAGESDADERVETTPTVAVVGLITRGGGGEYAIGKPAVELSVVTSTT